MMQLRLSFLAKFVVYLKKETNTDFPHNQSSIYDSDSDCLLYKAYSGKKGLPWTVVSEPVNSCLTLDATFIDLIANLPPVL